MADPLVWLPFDKDELGEPPEGLRYETVVPAPDDLPGSVGEVEFYVPAYNLGPGQGRVMEAMPRLRVVQTLTAGVDHIRAEVPDGVLLCNGRGIHNASTAELALTLTLASLRGIPGFVDDQHRGRWDQGWRQSLADKTVLILGYGDIGAAVEARLSPFEVEILRVARTARDGVHAIADLPELLPGCDVVVLVVPETDETRGLVDAGFLAQMKDGALLVNVARGPVVDTDALVAELGRGRIRAALDVTDPEPLPPADPLWSHPHVRITPHIASATQPQSAARVVIDNLRRHARGEPLVGRVDRIRGY